MANTPFKFRYVNEIVGAFVLLAFALAAVGIFAMARSQRWLEQEFDIRVTFPPEGTLGVQRGAKVVILGAQAGRVDSMSVRDDAIQATLRIREDYIRFVHADSVAVVKKEYGVAGDAFIDITLGSGTPLSRENAEIPIVKDTELLEIVQTVVEEVQSAIVPILKEVEATLTEYRGLAADFRSPTNDLNRLLVNLNGIAEGLRQGEGSVGRLLRDPAIADEALKASQQVNELLKGLEASIEEVNAILKSVRQTTDTLPEVAETVRGELRDVPGVVLQTRATLAETEKLLAGLQRHWLLRGAMEGGDTLQLIGPGAVGGGGGTKP